MAFKSPGDTNERFILQDDGKMLWGSGSAIADVIAARSSASTVTVTGNLAVTGSLTAGSQAAGTGPTLGALASGFSAGSLSTGATDWAGSITFTVATTTVATNTAVPVTFGNTHGAAPRAVVIGPGNAAAAAQADQVFVRAADVTATGFALSTGATDSGGHTYIYYYSVLF